MVEGPEDELLRGEPVLRAMFDSSPVGIAVIGMDGRIVRVNPALSRMLGYAAPELLGVSFFDVTHPEDRARDFELFREIVSGKRAHYHLEKRYIRKDGGVVWARLTASIGKPAAPGMPQVGIGLVEDVSAERKARAEQEKLLATLQRSNEQLNLALTTAQMGVWEWDIERDVVDWTPQAQKLLGLRGAPGRPLGGQNDHVHPDEREKLNEFLHKAVSEDFGPNRIELEFRTLNESGGYRRVTATGQIFRNKLGKATRVMSVVADNTRRHALEEQLFQAQKMDAIGQLAGGLAHDFNNLLTLMAANCGVLLEDLPALNPLRELVSEIKDAVDSGAGLTRQLLAFARRSEFQASAVDVNELLTRLQGMLARLVGRRLQLQLSLQPNSGTVWADPSQLEQMMLNLVVNARDAMPNGGTIQISTAGIYLDPTHVGNRSTSLSGPYVSIQVSDCGRGIAPEHLPRIFEPFFSTKEPGKGTGLGLAVVFGVIQRCHGQITVESEVGKGSTFKILLPRFDTDESGYPGF
jgi:two-component system cell cycle sensor histidine kinase/response regulator CckA